MEESSYDEEEIETWYEDDEEEERDEMGFLEDLHASFTSFQSLARDRKEKQQQQQQQQSFQLLQDQHISPQRMLIKTSSTFETVYSEYEEDVDGGVYEDYDYHSDRDDDDDLLLGVRNQMQELFRERKAQAVQASFVSCISVDSHDEEFEEQVIERWFGRDTLPGKLRSRAAQRWRG